MPVAPTANQFFLLLTLDIGSFSFTDGSGPPVPAPGGTLQAWMDIDLANAWRERIAQLLTDGALRASLYGPIDPNDRGALAQRQLRYMGDIAEAFANYYNALNIPWDSDPRARYVYRRWLAGDPEGLDVPQRKSHLYDKYTAYSSQWYQWDSAWPRSDRFDVQTAGDVHGLLPKRARELFNTYFQPNDRASRHKTEFVASTGLYIDLDENTTLWPDNAITSGALAHTRNRAYVTMDRRITLRGGARVYVQDSYDDYQRARQVYERFVNQCIMFGGVGFPYLPAPPNGAWVMTAGASAGVGDGVSPPHATDGWLGGTDPYNALPTDGPDHGMGMYGSGDPGSANWDDWRCFWWDFPFAGVDNEIPLKAVAPLVEYLTMYEEWHAELAARTPQQVVVQARAFAAYVNMQQIVKAGSQSQFLSGVGGADAHVEAEVTTPDPTITAVSTGIAAFGAAIATVGGPYGAVIGLVAGAVSAVMKVANAVIAHGVGRDNYRDDTGRWKPRIQPGWLQGSLVEGDGPQMYVEPPPGWVRPIRINLGPIDMTPGAYQPGQLPPSHNSIADYNAGTSTSKAPLVAMAAVGAALLFWLSRRK